MNTEKHRALAVRLDPETIAHVTAFAERNGFVNEGGSLNISAALRVIIAAGLSLPPEQITADLWRSAKGVIMREVVDVVLKTLQDYRDRD